MSDLIKLLRAAGHNETLASGELYLLAADRIAELEAQNRIFRNTESVDDSVWDALLEQVRTYQEKLDRVRGLPEKWRTDTPHLADYPEDGDRLRWCADELQSALGDEDE